MKNKLPHHHNEDHEMEYLSNQFSKVKDFQAVSDVFKQFSDTTRIRIFWLLCHCEECVTDIAALLEMSSPAVSHHLRILRNCNLIVSSRSGKEVYYRASESNLSQTMHQMIEQVLEIACPK